MTCADRALEALQPGVASETSNFLSGNNFICLVSNIHVFNKMNNNNQASNLQELKQRIKNRGFLKQKPTLTDKFISLFKMTKG